MASAEAPDAREITVELAYASPARALVTRVTVASGTDVAQVIRVSGIMRQFPEIDLSVNRVGIFGRLASPEMPVVSGDRVEIYRPLIITPKEARRRRAATGKHRGDQNVGTA